VGSPNIASKMNIKLLEKYCKNTCTEEELNSVLEWFDKEATSPEGKELLFKIWDELEDHESDLEIDFELILDKIHNKVNLKQSKGNLQQGDQNPVRSGRAEPFIRIFTRIAAIMLLPVLVFGSYMTFKYYSVRYAHVSVNQSYNEISSSVDAITKVTLPDGSNVWLNHSSTLRYPSFFSGDSRTVDLTGEGYFEVVHNSRIPFKVNVGDIQVIAKGTTFNIMAYSDEDRIETSLIGGVVELHGFNAERKPVHLATMKPTDLTIYLKSNKKISTQTIIDDRYFSWKSGKLVFNREPIASVSKKLSRWFNVDIQVADPGLHDITYTATFVNETLPQVMELLCLVSPIKYSISDRKEMSDGTYSKRKVILSYKGK
jgi:transmembrane sensor